MLSRIYLDTNALWSDRWPDLAAVRSTVLRLAIRNGIRLYLPKSVEIELREKWRREYAKTLGALRQQLARFSDLAGGDIVLCRQAADETPYAVDFNNPVQNQYEARYAQFLADYGVTVLPSTTRPLDEIVQMAASHTPPFGEKDKGFRDTIHLLSILEHLSATPVVEALFWTADQDLAASRVGSLIEGANVRLEICSTADVLKSRLTSTLDSGEHELWRQDQIHALAGARREVQKLKEWLKDALDGRAEISILRRIEVVLGVEDVKITAALTPLPSERDDDTQCPVQFSIRATCVALVAYVSPPNISVLSSPEWPEYAWQEALKSPEHRTERLTFDAEVESVAQLSPEGDYSDFAYKRIRLTKIVASEEWEG